jgi:hypothetical protein
LNNGKFNNSPLGGAAPFHIDGTYFPAKGKFKTPQKVKACGPFQYKPAGKEPVIYYHQNLALDAEAEVLLKAGDIPVLARKAAGKGYIYLLSATALGPDTPESFWNTDLPQKIVDFVLGGK